jgi:hypothetical protein
MTTKRPPLTGAQLVKLARAWSSPDDWNVDSVYVNTLEWLVSRRASGERVSDLYPGSAATSRAMAERYPS